MLTPVKGPRRLGHSDIEVAPIAYGMWRFAGTDASAAAGKVHAALDAGITLFDTADIYGIDDGLPVGAAEALFGEVLKAEPALRTRMVIATKAGIRPGTPYDSSADYLRTACDDCLRRMNLDVIDVFQIHRPDLLAHPAEVAETLTALREAGKIRAIGVSNHTAAQFEALQAHLELPIATHQPELSALCIGPIRDGVLDQCMARGVTPLAWSPLAGGRLMLDANEAHTTELADVIITLDRLAEAKNVSRTAMALAWLLVHPSRPIPIVGSQTPVRIADAWTALEVEMTRAEWYRVYEAALGEPLP